MPRFVSLFICLATVLVATPFTARAHTPYLQVLNELSPRSRVVTLDASFADRFFVPDVAFDNSVFQVTGPDGKTVAPDTVLPLQTRVVVEHRLSEGMGTWRFSTGRRLGAQFRTWELNGEQGGSRDAEQPMPEGARLLSHFQSVTMAETYLTQGEPNPVALAPLGEGVELEALTHPNDLYVGERFEFRVLFDGQPLADQKVEITEAVAPVDRKPEVVTLMTDDDGRAHFRLERSGAWLALVRHRAPAPAGAPVPEYSHSYTLSFVVLE